MSKAPPSPSFRPPTNRQRGKMPRLDRLSLGPPAAPIPAPPSKKEDSVSPVTQLDPAIVEPESSQPSKDPSPPASTSPPPQTRKSPSPERHVHKTSISAPAPTDDDIYSLDEEGWRRVAAAKGIDDLLKLGEGVSGSVSKCRLRKSGQVFAIKVHPPCWVKLMYVDNHY